MQAFLIPVILLLVLARSGLAAERPFEEGEFRLEVTRGERVVEHRYRLREGTLRIDRPGRIIPSPPVNLVDLETGRVSIIYPHNGTYLEFLAREKPVLHERAPGMPALPPGIGPGGGGPPGVPGGEPTKRIGPDPSKLPDGAELPEGAGIPDGGKPPPARPEVPQIPRGPGGGVPGIPAPPPVPVVPERGRGTAAMTLQPTGDTREIQGFPCTRFTLELPRREGRLVLWLTDESRLIPFHRLRHEGNERFGRPARLEWQDRLAVLLRQSGKFPLLLLHYPDEAPPDGEAGDRPRREISRWEVTRIQPGAIAGDGKDLFKVPAGWHRVQP